MKASKNGGAREDRTPDLYNAIVGEESAGSRGWPGIGPVLRSLSGTADRVAIAGAMVLELAWLMLLTWGVVSLAGCTSTPTEHLDLKKIQRPAFHDVLRAKCEAASKPRRVGTVCGLTGCDTSEMTVRIDGQLYRCPPVG